MVFLEADILIHGSRAFGLEPVAVGHGRRIYRKRRGDVVRCAQAQGSFEKARVGSVGIDGAGGKPAFDVSRPFQIEGQEPFVRIRYDAVFHGRNYTVFRH